VETDRPTLRSWLVEARLGARALPRRERLTPQIVRVRLHTQKSELAVQAEPPLLDMTRTYG
jgi:hypothetical protein